MYTQRTNPIYQKLRQMIRRGDLGHIKRITWIITDWYRPQAYHESSTWRSTWKSEGGGALINQNPHQLDLWQWLSGMPDRIFAKVIVENNKLTFYRNVISEGEFNKINTVPFGRPECWECHVMEDASGGPQHVGILQNFTNAVLNGTELLAKGEDGLFGLTISNAIHLSGWTGETIDVKNFPDERFYELLQEKIRNSTVVKKESQVIADTRSTY